METKEFYMTLGRIAFTYSRIDFLLGSLGKVLGISNNHIELFAKRGIKPKLDLLLKCINETNNSFYNHTFDLLIKLQEYTKTRNAIMHGLPLFSIKDIRFYKYDFDKKSNQIIDDSLSFRVFEFIQFDIDYINLHNELSIEIERIENSTI